MSIGIVMERQFLKKAARAGNIEIVKMLLEKGVSYVDYEIAKVLIDAGVDVNMKDEYGKSLLFKASKLETVKLLVEHGADLNARGMDGRSSVLILMKLMWQNI